MVNDPLPATTRNPFAVVSFVAMVALMTLEVVQSELVTTREVAEAAKFTLPDALLIVCAPVVPAAVMVFSMDMLPALETENLVVVAFTSNKSVGAMLLPTPIPTPLGPMLITDELLTRNSIVPPDVALNSDCPTCPRKQ
jgi:hypothetical protein